MAYNSYNTRNSGRYNTPGRFVPGGELAPGGPVGVGTRSRQNYNSPNNQLRPNQQRQQQAAPSPNLQQVQPPPPQNQLTPAMQQHLLQNLDVEMKTEASDAFKDTSEPKPHWMKSKLVGVKKITKKERRRRQNENLRRLLAPKNALMVLNEMLPGDPRESAQFKVEPAPVQFPRAGGNTPTFCAELHVDGTDYKGYGDNKVAARNDAAEQAIRDLIIKRMAKVNSIEAGQGQGSEGGAGGGGAEGEEGGEGEAEAPLPMIQLASFALHKLFAEWECDGHKVPQLKPAPAPPLCDDISEASGGTPSAGRVRAARQLPAGAATMHPCMLLTYMRPHLEYRELAVHGDRPQNMLFTMGVDVDGVTYVGKAPNKREARKLAARAACMALYNVQFTDGAPPPASAPAPSAPANTAATNTSEPVQQ